MCNFFSMQQFFFFMEKTCPVLEIFSFFNFETFHLFQKLWRHVEYIFQIVNYLVLKLSQLIDKVRSNILRKIITWFVELYPKSRPFLIYQSTPVNQKQIMMCFLFFNLLKVCTKTIKNCKYLLKVSRSHYIAILSES